MTLNGGIVTGSDVPAIARDPQYADRFFSTFAAGVNFIAIHADQPPFDDVRLRQAVNLAIDRSRMVKLLGGVIATSPWSQTLPPNLLGDEESDVYPITPDVEGAKRLIASTGLATPIKITLVSSAPLTADPLAVQDALEAVGFDVALKLLPADVYCALPQRPDVPLGAFLRGLGSGLSGRDHVLQPASDLSQRYARCGQTTAGSATRSSIRPWRRSIGSRSAPSASRGSPRLSTETMRDSAPLLPYASARHVTLVSDRIGNYRFGETKGEYLAALFLRP